MGINLKSLENRYFPQGPQAGKLTASDGFGQFVERRFHDMTKARQRWYERQKRTTVLYDVYKDWLLDGENFEKAVRFPTLRDVGRALVDEIMRHPPEAILRPEYGEKPNRVQALQFALEERKNSIYEKRTQEDCINDMIFSGEGFRFTGYYDINKVCPNSGDMIPVFNDVGTERMDPRKVYLDDQGRYLWNPNGMDMKRDAILKFEVPRTTFIDRMEENDDAMNLSGLSVNARAMSGDMSTPTQEESNVLAGMTKHENMVNAYLYVNQEEQFYGMVANGETVIEPKTIPNDHRRIPLVNYKFERRRDDVFWGISLAELLAPHIYLQDTIVNLEIMGQKLRLMSPMMMDAGLGYNKKVHKVQPRAVWKMNVQPGKSLKDSAVPIQFGQGDPQGAYGLNNLIESQITITSGIDRRGLFLSPGELATQTAFKNQTFQKRVSALVFSNEVEAEGQLTELMVSDMKQYLGGMITDKKGKKRYRKVEAKGFVVEQGEDGGEAKFTQKQGNVGYFDLTDEAMDVDVKVRVNNVREHQMLQEAKSARVMQFLPVVANIFNVAGERMGEVMDEINFAGLLEEGADAIGLNMDKVLNSSSKTQMDRIKREHMAMQLEVDVPVPDEESYEQSLDHKRQHEKLRFRFINGKITNEDSAVWKTMSATAKKVWQDHYNATMANIRAKVLPESEEEEKKKPVMPQPEQKAGTQVRARQPASVAETPPGPDVSPEGQIASRTLLQ